MRRVISGRESGVAARLDFNLAGVLPENPGSSRSGEPFAG